FTLLHHLDVSFIPPLLFSFCFASLCKGIHNLIRDLRGECTLDFGTRNALDELPDGMSSRTQASEANLTSRSDDICVIPHDRFIVDSRITRHQCTIVSGLFLLRGSVILPQ